MKRLSKPDLKLLKESLQLRLTELSLEKNHSAKIAPLRINKAKEIKRVYQKLIEIEETSVSLIAAAGTMYSALSKILELCSRNEFSAEMIDRIERTARLSIYNIKETQ